MKSGLDPTRAFPGYQLYPPGALKGNLQHAQRTTVFQQFRTADDKSIYWFRNTTTIKLNETLSEITFYRDKHYFLKIS